METSQITTIVFAVLFLAEVLSNWQPKKIIKELETTVKRLQQESTEKIDSIIVLVEQLHRYKQAIEDIKEIAGKIYKAYEICEFGCDSWEAKQIIQKCEEVNNE